MAQPTRQTRLRLRELLLLLLQWRRLLLLLVLRVQHLLLLLQAGLGCLGLFLPPHLLLLCPSSSQLNQPLRQLW